MSEAAASAAGDHLDDTCDHIVSSVEGQFAKFSTTDRDKRTTQLNSLIRDCYEFKKLLERQEHAYSFHCSISRMRYDNERMYNRTGEESVEQVVGVSLWPMLVKVVGPQQWEVVEKEVVRTIPGATEKSQYSDMEGCMPWLSEKDIEVGF